MAFIAWSAALQEGCGGSAVVREKRHVPARRRRTGKKRKEKESEKQEALLATLPPSPFVPDDQCGPRQALAPQPPAPFRFLATAEGETTVAMGAFSMTLISLFLLGHNPTAHVMRHR